MTSKEKNSFRAKKPWKEFRKKMLIKHNYTCEICGMRKKKGLNVHHKDDHNYDDLKMNKFSVLCGSCHKEIERLLRRKVLNIDDYTRNFKRVFKGSKKYDSN